MKTVPENLARMFPTRSTPDNNLCSLKQNNAHQEAPHKADETAQAWNAFNGRSGSFADEYTTL